MIAEGLAARGVDVRVLTTHVDAVSEQNGGAVRRVMRRWSWRELPYLAWLLWRDPPDVLLLMYIGWIDDDHPIITFVPTVAKLVRPGTRCITQFENAIGLTPGTSFPARAARKALKSCWERTASIMPTAPSFTTATPSSCSATTIGVS